MSLLLMDGGGGRFPFLRPRALPRIAYTRTGPATGGYGAGSTPAVAIYSVAADVPRYNVLGEVHGEGQRTNDLANSNAFTSGWTKINGGTGVAPTVTAAYGLIAAPDGSFTASRVQMDRGAGTSSSDFSGLSIATTNALNSIWIRTLSGTAVLQVSESSVNPKTVTTTWQRLPGLAAQSVHRVLALGNIVGGSQTADVLVWEGQSEAAALFASTQIPTSGGAGTRGPDTFALPLIRAGAGGMILALRPGQAAPASTDQIALQLGTDANRLLLRCVGGTNTLRLSREVASGGLVDASGDLGTLVPGTLVKVAITWDDLGNAWAMMLGGSWRTVAGVPTGFTSARLMNNVAGSRSWFGTGAWGDEYVALMSQAQATARLAALPI